MVVVMFGFFSSMVLLALFTQKVLGYDAWTSGLVLAPGGVGNLLSLLIAGRLITRMDQRLLLAVGCLLNAYATYEHVHPHARTSTTGRWRGRGFVQGARRRLHLRAAQRGRPGHHPAGADGQRHRPAQRGPQPGRRHRRRAASARCWPGAARSTSPTLVGARQRVGSGDGGAAAAWAAHFVRPGRRQLHGGAARHRPRSTRR